MKKIKIIVFSVLLMFPASFLFAQSHGNSDKVPFSIGLFPPLTTNGTNAGKCINQFSLNLISGYSAGLAGLEFAGFSNTERDFVRGTQFAGFGNFVTGEFAGFQFAGFGNFNKGISNGFQFAGFSNFNYAQADGVLVAGFANFTNGKSLAIQTAGALNICEDVQGVQVSGLANIVKGNGEAIQLSGGANITTGEVDGVQMAGFLNFSKKQAKNVQLAGALNIVSGDVGGVQISGFANLASGKLNGTQIAGALNVAREVNGLQLGFINIADTIKSGIPIGVLSIVKHGFRELELSVGEGLNAQVAFKIGVEKFYTIFSAGTQFLGSRDCWAYGYGIGTHLANNDSYKLQLEAMTYHVNEGETYTDVYNDLQQIKLLYTKKISPHFCIFAGPAVNLLITNNRKEFRSRFAPYTIVAHHGEHTGLDGWLGITAGIHIN